MPLLTTLGSGSARGFGRGFGKGFGLQTAGAAIEDVFSTNLYTGNGSTQTITNGIDLAGEGGLVWIKNRDITRNHNLTSSNFDIAAGELLFSNTTDSVQVRTDRFQSFNTDGFTVGAGTGTGSSGENYASWTFRKSPRFFDVVTYTGDTDGSSGQTISHSLGSTPGMIIVKRTDTLQNWYVSHRYDPSQVLQLNKTDAATQDTDYQNLLGATDTTFTADYGSNTNGATYVAYLFAHDPLGPSGDGSDGLIECGSYTTDVNGDASIDLGWEPQMVISKAVSITGVWFMFDNMRGMPTTGSNTAQKLAANSTDAETTDISRYINANATGFNSRMAANSEFVYVAIRRGPMRAPESGSEVFSVKNYAATNTAAEVTHDVTFDTEINANRDVTVTKFLIRDSLRDINGTSLITSNTGDETPVYSAYWSRKDQRTMYAPSAFDAWWASDSSTVNNHISYGLVRAPNFFDVVAYTGDGVAGRTVPHNLGVAPEMMIVKARGTPNGFASDWMVFHGSFATPSENYIVLNQGFPQEAGGSTNPWGGSVPTESQFFVGTFEAVNWPSEDYIAYLFASLPGVSKVGSYTGNGTNQTIDCGFTSGARFILIKRTDSTGDWYVWDTARGIVAANDPHLSLNTTAAEVTTDDSIDPDSSGFIVNQVVATNININTATYIFYAIA